MPIGGMQINAMQIGVIGLGSMGAHMARNLAVGGDTVLAYDIDPRLVAAVASGAITPAASIAEIASRCGLVISMVWDDRALREVVFGVDGILADRSFAGCAVDLSTTSAAIALELGAAFAQCGATFLDGAVIGGGAPAAKAAISPIVISGDESAYRRHLDRLSRLGRCDYVGTQGNAKVTKIINNLLVGVVTAANAEAFSLGMASGLELGEMMEWLGGGPGASTVLTSYFGRYVRDGKYGDGLIGHGLMAKDLSLACALADGADFPAHLSELARQLYVAAGSALGKEEPFPSILDFFRHRPGSAALELSGH